MNQQHSNAASPTPSGTTDRPHALLVPTAAAAMGVTVCGLTVFSRLICSLDRASSGVHILAPADFPGDLVGRARAAAAAHPTPARSSTARSLQELSTERGLIIATRPLVLDHRILDPILKLPDRDDRIVRVRRPGERTGALWFIGARHTAALPALAASEPNLATALEAHLEAQPHTDLDPGPELCDVVVSGDETAAIEDKLFTLARKASDSWVAKSFDRRISLWVTRRLIGQPISPNQITVGATAIGLLGGLLLAAGTYWAQVVGSLLLTFSIIVDGCDGEVARIKYMESDFGRRLDFFLDNVVNTLAIFTVGAGHYWAGGPPFYLWASAVNATVAAASVLPVYWLFFQGNKESVTLGAAQATAPAAKSFLDRVEDMSGRDFAYVILGLSLFGRGYWFASIALVGLTGFFVIVAAVAALKFMETGSGTSPR